MTNYVFNPLSGKNSSGDRFNFRVRAVSRRDLFLPLEMRSLPQIRLLLDDVSPLIVFNTDNLHTARRRFASLRMKYDFPFWAAVNLRVPDKNSPHTKVPLILNDSQRYLTDIFTRRLAAGLPGKYLVTKSVPECGLSTCIQAYILWMQSYRYEHDSITCSPSIGASDRLRYSLPNHPRSAFFTRYDAHRLHGCKAGYVHLADLHEWYDPDAEASRDIFSLTSSGWSRDSNALFVLEGDTPVHSGFNIRDFQNYAVKESIRISQLASFFRNPYFVNWYVLLSDPRMVSDFCYIDLDNASLYLQN